MFYSLLIMTTPSLSRKPRNFALDVLRVLACFLVIWQHTGEFYYIGPDSAVVRETSTYQIGWLDSADRSCIALFVMISGYFLLPMKTDIKSFFRHRFTRILLPFLFWCIVYAVYYVFYRGDSLHNMWLNIAHIPVNWGVDVGHLWYVYMLIGLYLLIPVISPFLERASRGTLRFYLILWFIFSFIDYGHVFFPLWLGECYWNPTPLFYYFTGFAGFLILGYYFKRFGALKIGTAVALLIVGYLSTVLVFNALIPTAANCEELELPWEFCAPNVALMAMGIFSLVSRIPCTGSSLAGRILTDVSIVSYAIYLAHIMVLNFYHDVLSDCLGTVLLQVPVISICTLVTTYLIVKILSYLPKSHYWLGA